MISVRGDFGGRGVSFSHGLRENLPQFALLGFINSFVGMMVGLERTVVPLIGEQDFGLASKTAIVSFIVAFGVTKALCNLLAGRLSEKWGRKPVLVLGWVIGLPVPFVIIWAKRWFWFDVANVFLGVNQALCWSMTVNMQVDLAGPAKRGLAVGLNEFSGYLSVGLMAWVSGYIASITALRPQPFYLGIAIVFGGLMLSLFFTRDTLVHARFEAYLQRPSTPQAPSAGDSDPVPTEFSFRQIFALGTWGALPLVLCSQTGLVNNLNDGMAWGIYPLYFAGFGLGVEAIGTIKAVYPATWGVLQLLIGPVSDQWGRKHLIGGGMVVQAAGIWLTVLVNRYPAWVSGALLQGVGTAMVYPTLLAAVGDLARPEWRATCLGVYRFWRDLGYAIGALLAGIIADWLGMAAAIHSIAALTLFSGLLVLLAMPETLPACNPANKRMNLTMKT